MSAPLRRTWGPLLAGVLAVSLAGCGGGGFGGDEPTAEPTKTIRSYVALGDGFAAAPYVGKQDRDRGCLRSRENYAAQVARRLGIPVTDVSCTSASTRSVLEPSDAPNGKGRIAAQLDAVKEDTDLVTITMGISDDQLLYRGFFVCMAAPCGQRIPPQTLAAQSEAVGVSMSAIVRAITAKAPDATVVVVGYPQIAPTATSCKKLPAMTDLELTGVNALFFTVNRELQRTARATGAIYVDLTEVTKDHDVCGAQPWIRGTSSKPNIRAALHPLAPEQRAAADAILAAIKGS